MRFIGANEFEDFISGYGIWIIISCLGVAFIVSVIFLILNINKAKKAKLEISESLKSEPLELPKENKETKTDTNLESVEPIKEIQSETISDYNISYDQLKDEWVVKKSGASRASKRCKTKDEALETVKNFLKK